MLSPNLLDPRIADHVAQDKRTKALRERYRTTAQHSRLGKQTPAAC